MMDMDYDGGPAEMVSYAPDSGIINRFGAEVIAWDRIREQPDMRVERISDVVGYAPYTGLYRVMDIDAERSTYYLVWEGQ